MSYQGVCSFSCFSDAWLLSQTCSFSCSSSAPPAPPSSSWTEDTRSCIFSDTALHLGKDGRKPLAAELDVQIEQKFKEFDELVATGKNLLDKDHHLTQMVSMVTLLQVTAMCEHILFAPPTVWFYHCLLLVVHQKVMHKFLTNLLKKWALNSGSEIILGGIKVRMRMQEFFCRAPCTRALSFVNPELCLTGKRAHGGTEEHAWVDLGALEGSETTMAP